MVGREEPTINEMCHDVELCFPGAWGVAKPPHWQHYQRQPRGETFLRSIIQGLTEDLLSGLLLVISKRRGDHGSCRLIALVTNVTPSATLVTPVTQSATLVTPVTQSATLVTVVTQSASLVAVVTQSASLVAIVTQSSML